MFCQKCGNKLSTRRTIPGQYVLQIHQPDFTVKNITLSGNHRDRYCKHCSNKTTTLEIETQELRKLNETMLSITTDYRQQVDMWQKIAMDLGKVTSALEDVKESLANIDK